MRILKTAFLIAVLSLTGCAGRAVKDNQIIVVDSSPKIQQNIEEVSSRLNIEGIIPFKNVDHSKITGINQNDPLITVSPDNKVMFFMEQAKVQEEPLSLMGQRFEKVNLIRLDVETGEKYIIAKEIPFINLVKWNKPGNIVAFCGGWELRLYDVVNSRFLLQNEVKNDSVTYFGWSPDGRKLFTEHPNLINGSIYYVDPEGMLHSYETKEYLYYKGKLDEDYFYASKMTTIEQTKGNIEYKMVIADKDGQIMNESGSGRFRDSYGKSMLHLGESGSGLYYYPDVNDMAVKKVLSESFVYDAKFIEGGKIVYIEKNTVMAKNNFILHIVDSKGNEIKSFEVSGPSFSLSPDGKTGFVGGRKWEKLDFMTDSIINTGSGAESRYSAEDEKVFNAIRGAMDTYYRFELTGQYDDSSLNKYFLDTKNPEQWALFDMKKMLESKKGPMGFPGTLVDINLSLKSYNRYNLEGLERASAVVTGWAENSEGSGIGIEQALEMIKVNDKWYVTGFSTFPESKELKEVRKKIEQYVKEIQAGKLFDGQLKDREIQIGQIQFWQMSDPHFAGDIENANYCKVYLKVTENGTEVIYKMVLDKKNQNYWKVNELSSDRLYWLF